jgi:hypothetical protein
MIRWWRWAVVCSLMTGAVALAWQRSPRAASSIEEEFKYGSIGAEDQ